MRTTHRILLVAAVAIALASPAFAEGVKHTDDEQKVIESTYHWYANMMSASDHANAPAKQPAPRNEVFVLAEMSHHKLNMALKETGYTNYFVKTVFIRFSFSAPTLTLGVSDHERTNSFVESQSGPHPIHTDNSTLRKI